MKIINQDDDESADGDGSNSDGGSNHSINILLTSEDPSITIRQIFERSGSGRFRRRGNASREKDARK